jgi:hypothetical protein
VIDQGKFKVVGGIALVAFAVLCCCTLQDRRQLDGADVTVDFGGWDGPRRRRVEDWIGAMGVY